MILTAELRNELKNIVQFHADYRFLKDNGLHSVADLDRDIRQTEESISALTEQRSKIHNRMRYETDPVVLADNKAERAAITKQIKPLRQRIKRLHCIRKDTSRLLNLLKTELQAEYELKHPVNDRLKALSRFLGPER